MQIKIVATGMRMPGWVDQGVKEYLKRMPPQLNVQLTEIPSGTRAKNTSVEKILKQEAEKIRAAIPAGCRLIILDERGRSQTTIALANKMTAWMQDGRDVVFVIGGADGIHVDMKKQAQETWSLSGFTLPHGLARVVLVEQLYRAWSVINNHPYHRA